MKALIDLHTHTVSSGHAYSTLLENIAYSKSIGLKYYGVSDHGPSLQGASHWYYFSNIRAIPEYYDGIRILRGCELNILEDANVDLEDNVLSKLDYSIASMHIDLYPLNRSIEENMEVYSKLVKNKYITILGHPDDGRFDLDHDKLCKMAKDNNKIIEINCASISKNSFRLNGYENVNKLIKACKKYGTNMIIGSDAHFCSHIGEFDDVIKLLLENDIDLNTVINFNEELIEKLILNS